MAAEALVVPDRQLPPDGEYRPEEASLAQAAGVSGDALADFYRKAADVEFEVRRYERRYQETREEIAHDDALALARRIRNLHRHQSFDGRGDYIAFLAGQCLELREAREVAGEVYAACARLEVKRPPEWAGAWRQVTLAVPAGIRVHGPDATFGTHTFAWLCYRSERVARTLARRGFPPDSPGYRMFDGGGFALVLDSIRPGEVAEPIVLAPDEDVVAKHVERAAASPDHWDALAMAAKVLWRSRQPPGEALGECSGEGRPDVTWLPATPGGFPITPCSGGRHDEAGGLPGRGCGRVAGVGARRRWMAGGRGHRGGARGGRCIRPGADHGARALGARWARGEAQGRARCVELPPGGASCPRSAGRPEVPERFARTARFLATNRALEAGRPNQWAVLVALATLAGGCGYRMEGAPSLEPAAPAPAKRSCLSGEGPM